MGSQIVGDPVDHDEALRGEGGSFGELRRGQ